MQATLQVQATDEQLQQISKELYAEVKESLKLDYIAIDLEMMLEILPYSRSVVEEFFLTHPKVKMCERRKGARGKRIWIYEPVKKAILEIMDSWVY